MNTFLFTAVDRDGNSVSERVEAENLSQARYKLEINGYSEITFYESELSKDVAALFDEKHARDADKHPKHQVKGHFDTRLSRYFFNILKVTSFWWIILLYLLYSNRDLSTVLLFGGSVLVVAYISLPSVFFNCLHEAHCWNRNALVRFWSQIAKGFNRIAYVKIPYFEIDVHLACADAREGDQENALRRIAKYQNDPRVSERIYKAALVRIYYNARDFDKVRALYEQTLREGNGFNEEMIDYAICMARRHEAPSIARGVLEKVFDKEQTALAELFIPYCQGIIEVEDGNYSQAEFYLRQASKRLEPFRNNGHMVGLKSEVKAFLAIALGRQGARAEAARLLDEAKPYLVAVRENELLEKCERVLN